MALYRLDPLPPLADPVLVGAFDGWVDAGAAATAALALVTADAPVVATFDPDALFDYRARRPALEIVDGRLDSLAWPKVTVTRVRAADRDVLVLAGNEPDARWRAFTEAVVELAMRVGATGWVSLGAVPSAVPHTRPVPILGTSSAPGLLRGGVEPGPTGLMKVPAALLSVVEKAMAEAGVPAVGYFAQIPHYVTGPYPTASLALLRALGGHLDAELPTGRLEAESRALRTRLDAAAAADETTRTYVERLEAMVDESRLPSGDELISEIEQFLRQRSGENP